MHCGVKNDGFVFVGDQNGYSACYSEKFKVPNFSNLVMSVYHMEELYNFYAAYELSDILNVIPSELSFDGQEKIVAVKLIDNRLDVRERTIEMIKAVKESYQIKRAGK